MAYTIAITKGAVSKIRESLYKCNVLAVVNDGENDIFTSIISVNYNSNPTDLSIIEGDILKALKTEWDEFVEEQNIKNAAAYDTMCSNIQTAAQAYINS